VQITIITRNYQINTGIKMIITCLLLVCLGHLLPAQNDSLIENPRITWIEQFPQVIGEKNIQNHKKRFSDFLFGKRNSLELTKPVNIVARNSDEYWVLDQENGVIFQIHDKVGDIPHIKGKQFIRFPSLVGFCFYSGNKMLFTDSYLNKIFVYTPDKKEIKPLNDTLTFDQPTGVAYSEVNHEIWVVETASHSISVLNDKGQRKKIIGKRGVEPGEFNFPTSIWIDKTGNAFVVDALNFRVQVFNKEGELISVFGKNGDGGGNFARPKGIATDSDGNIYVADALFNAVQVFDISGCFLYTFGLQGRDKGEFWMPSGIFIDDNNNIFVADCYNSRVQIFKFNK
jgi:hypothetical protein